ncbi:hypothetical protein COCSUDRAFT_57096 [Coccomyxa subellipsoidea C-169]|uniref:Uncharacterized protein n=1 Tax=Coccomyxa subellipsoidea (strain C-169) TaxID=574566 RepID=I0YS16_COCSC|nr:hypothetical protein COCSUDRAFT_57096 [Coccomyxa subellipsoidea C-169]EIE21185.1 hypothetical protein COCSUDRAFT_57096 [Coccomyxa subellipsoidea C-169]|eukprot:XP_005645729.1 hypothetical protein COCSUDRAFT_57096 [Coccomyxa subellipsoidea C-169]
MGCCVAGGLEGTRAGPLRPAGCCGTQTCAIVSGSAAGLYKGFELPHLRARCVLRRMCRARAGFVERWRWRWRIGRGPERSGEGNLIPRGALQPAGNATPLR